MGIKKFIGKNKFKFNRGYQWVILPGLALVVTQALQKYIKLPIYILYPLCCIVIWLVGHIDLKIGLYSAESEYTTEKNTFMAQMREEINK